MKFHTPLRYPGGKGKLSYFIKALLEKNSLVDGHYVEPFAGGAGIALELLQHEYVSHIHINDIDKAVFSFWFSILNYTDEFCRKIYDTDVNMEEWHKQKHILKNGQDPLELGFAAFFLNRTNRSGILNAGVIGGLAQAGKWKLDARFNKIELIKRIETIALKRERIHIYNEDAIRFLSSIRTCLPKRALVYLDPPYYVKGQGLYRNFYEHQDHENIRDFVSQMSEIPWLVSYDNCEQIKSIYSAFETFEYSLQYTAQDKKVGSELMVLSKGLLMPDVQLGKSVAA